MKQAARLTSSLLARKGFASPSPESVYALQDAALNKSAQPKAAQPHADFRLPSEHPLAPISEAREPIADTVRRPVSETVVAKPKPATSPSPAAKSTSTIVSKTNTIVSKNSDPQAKTGCDSGTDCKHKTAMADHTGKRVAMTLRLDSDRHLKLRVLSAHANMSSQEILTAALDEYLSREASTADLRHCDCLHASAR